MVSNRFVPNVRGRNSFRWPFVLRPVSQTLDSAEPGSDESNYRGSSLCSTSVDGVQEMQGSNEVTPGWVGAICAIIGAVCAGLGYFSRYVSDKKGTQDALAAMAKQVEDLTKLVDQMRFEDAKEQGRREEQAKKT